MSANLFGERFLGKREAAWHNLGTVFTDDIDASEAFERAGLTYKISTEPLKVSVDTIFGTQLIEVPNKAAIVREPTHDDPDFKVFGVVGSDYEFLQLTDIAELLNPLTETWPVETVGALGDGEKIFVSLDAGEDTIAGEDYKNYFLLNETITGKSAMKFVFTPVRVVCQNTLNLGLAQATVSANVKHGRGFSDFTTWLLTLVNELQASMTTSRQALEHFAKVALTAEDVRDVLMAVYPYPKRPAKLELMHDLEDSETEAAVALYNEASRANEVWGYYVDRADTFRNAAIMLYNKFNDEYPDNGGTAYALFQAVCESADWRAGRGEIDASAVFGARSLEKRRAWNALEFVARN